MNKLISSQTSSFCLRYFYETSLKLSFRHSCFLQTIYMKHSEYKLSTFLLFTNDIYDTSIKYSLWNIINKYTTHIYSGVLVDSLWRILSPHFSYEFLKIRQHKPKDATIDLIHLKENLILTFFLGVKHYQHDSWCQPGNSAARAANILS